jgi:hypothetical protein
MTPDGSYNRVLLSVPSGNDAQMKSVPARDWFRDKCNDAVQALRPLGSRYRFCSWSLASGVIALATTGSCGVTSDSL